MVWEVDPTTKIQTLNEAVSISHNAHTFEKLMNATIFSPLMDTENFKLLFLTMVLQPVQENENWIQTRLCEGWARLSMPKTYFMSNPFITQPNFGMSYYYP